MAVTGELGKLRAPRSARGRVMAAAGMVMVGSLGIQTSSSLSASLFSALGPIPVSSMRMLVAAIVMLALVRVLRPVHALRRPGRQDGHRARRARLVGHGRGAGHFAGIHQSRPAHVGRPVGHHRRLGGAGSRDSLHDGHVVRAYHVGARGRHAVLHRPAMSVIIAALILRQTITAVAVIGVIVVSLAGALLVWSSGGDAVNG